MSRTILITGSASGIGHATSERLKGAGDRVIGVDRSDADIAADLATAEGRMLMIREARRLAPEGLDGIVAGAGISQPGSATIAVNYFGAVATLEGLRPLLAASARPRAVAICSTAVMLPGNEEVVAACLAGDEARALGLAAAAPDSAYLDSKRALSLWLRKAAVTKEWAGAGTLLNGVAPGVVETAMTAPLLSQPAMIDLIAQSNPVAVDGYAKPEEIAELIVFLLGLESHYLLGQLIFIDGGTDAILRPETV